MNSFKTTYIYVASVLLSFWQLYNKHESTNVIDLGSEKKYTACNF